MKIKRAIHIDFHTLPNIVDFGERYDAETFASILASAEVEYVNLVASCNIGFCYFPTRTGIPYPYMKGDRFGDTLAALKKRGIGVSAYINCGLAHEIAFRHPDWTRVNRRGRIVYGDKTGNFFRLMDFNSDGYRAYLLDIVAEIEERYPAVDGYFFDGFKINACYCDKCTAERKALGYDPRDEKKAREFAYEKMRALCNDIKKIVKDKHVFFCGMRYDEDFHDHIEVECLPSGDWGYDYFPQAAAYARGLGRVKPRDVLYMTGRFQRDWGDFGGIRSVASFEYDMYDALASGFQFMIGDHLHPAENADQNLYSIIGSLYDEFRVYEDELVGAKYVAEIGILCPGDLFDFDAARYIGATRMLEELKYSYDLIPLSADLSRYRVILLCDEELLNEETAEKLSLYLADGGKLLSTGNSALTPDKRRFAMKEYSFLKYCGQDKGNSPYFTFADGEEAGSKWAEYESRILMKNLSGKSFAGYIQPYNKRYFDGRHGYFYTPPKCDTPYSSAAIHGNVCHISFAVFTAYAEYFLGAHRTLVKKALSALLEDKLIETDCPLYVRINLTKKGEHEYLHVRTTFPEKKNNKGVIEAHVTIPAGFFVAVRGEYVSATDVLTGETCPTAFDGKYTHFTLPKITGYAAIRLER